MVLIQQVIYFEADILLCSTLLSLLTKTLNLLMINYVLYSHNNNYINNKHSIFVRVNH